MAVDTQVQKRVRRLRARLSDAQIEGALSNPVFILSAPRSGSTLLFSLLGNSPDVWTIGGESHGLYRQFDHLNAADDRFSSGALSARHADPETVEHLRLLYIAALRNVQGRELYLDLSDDPDTVRGGAFLEKTPRNALNISFVLTIFPNARFIFLYREPHENISSIIEGWERGAQTGQFVTYRHLLGWPRDHWCFLLPPGWQSLAKASLAQIAAFQWCQSNEAILSGLSQLSPERWTSLSYQQLIDDPAATIKALCRFCDIQTGEALDKLSPGHLPLSASTISAPVKDKWRRHEAEIVALEPQFLPLLRRLEALG